jgi:uncharacterized protein
MKIFKNVFCLFLIPVCFSLTAQESKNSLFWEISGNGLQKPSYLYGTMHSTDERVFRFKKGVMEAFENSDAYAMELDMGSGIKPDILKLLVMDSTITIQSLLNKEDFKMVSDFLRDSIGQNIMLYNKMQPMFVASLISQRGLKSDKSEALDLHLYSMAKEQGKKLIGLETIEEQVNAFKSIPYEKQAEGLVEAVKNSGHGSEEMEELLRFYMQGDLDKLFEMTRSKDMSENFEEIFLTRRNHNMADRSEKYIKEKSVFIAIGAAHLPGEEGVIELLRKKGYKVNPL